MQEGNGLLYELTKIEPRTVVFRDNTPDLGTGNKRKRTGGELPNLEFMEIHAAIAQVLHTSDAGDFFDTLSEKVSEDCVGAELTRSWGEMEET